MDDDQKDLEGRGVIEWISLKRAGEIYGVSRTTISRLADRKGIAKSPDPVDSKIMRVDRKHLAAVMKSSVKYQEKVDE
jgi:hypothetical protein